MHRAISTARKVRIIWILLVLKFELASKCPGKIALISCALPFLSSSFGRYDGAIRLVVSKTGTVYCSRCRMYEWWQARCSSGSLR